MRLMACIALAVTQLAGCCWQPPTACVAGAAPHETCVNIDDAGACRVDDGGTSPPPLRSCYADLRDGTCADLGFTVGCGAYSVRPGSGC